MEKSKSSKNEQVIWITIGGVIGSVLGALAFYDGWFE